MVNTVSACTFNTVAFVLMQTLTQPDIFKEAIQYVLPKSLLEPLYHFFYYFDIMSVSCEIMYADIRTCRFMYINT